MGDRAGPVPEPTVALARSADLETRTEGSTSGAGRGELHPTSVEIPRAVPMALANNTHTAG